jgi:hypothetical protein
MPFKMELAMESYLIENENILQINDDDIVKIIDFELPVKRGRKNSDGRIDLLAKYNDNRLGIIELKNDKIIMDHYNQLNQYFVQKDQIIKKHNDIFDNPKKIEWIGILVGTDVDEEVSKGIFQKKLYIQNKIPLLVITLNRYKGNNGQVYIIANTFGSVGIIRDHTKYRFNGVDYGKSRLVLAVVREYVNTHPNCSKNDLENVFEKKLQGSYGVIEDFDKAKEIGQKIPRHFINDDEMIILNNGQKIAVSNEWNIKNIKNFIIKAKKLNFKINDSE